MYGKYRNPPSKTSNGGFIPFVPNSTVGGVKAADSFIKNAKASTLGESSSLKRFAPSTLGSAQGSSLIASKGKDLFGFSNSSDGGFWMPGMSVAAQPGFETQTDDGLCEIRGQGEGPPKPIPVVMAVASVPKEVYDGYNLWREFHSRTKNRPFWHCKETGATRWEKPVMGAVQGADKMPDKEPSADEDLKDGGVDEAANRRAFLAALYEWRNGGKPAGENDEEKDNSSGGPEAREGGMGNTRVKIHEQDDKGRKIVAEKTLSKNLPQRQLSAHAAAKSASRAPQAVSLHSAAGNGEAAVVREMLQAGTDVHRKDRMGLSAMHYAASGGHVTTIEALVCGGGDPNARDDDGDTPLHSATKNRHAAAVRRLVELGVDTTLANARGNTALKLARMFRTMDIESILSAAEAGKISAVKNDNVEDHLRTVTDTQISESASKRAAISLSAENCCEDARSAFESAPKKEGLLSQQQPATASSSDAPSSFKGGTPRDGSPTKEGGKDSKISFGGMLIGGEDGHAADFGCGCDLDGEEGGPEGGGRVFEVRKRGFVSADEVQGGLDCGVSCGPDEGMGNEDESSALHAARARSVGGISYGSDGVHAEDGVSSNAVGHAVGVGVEVEAAEQGGDDVRALLEALRERARAQVEDKWASRPGTAQSNQSNGRLPAHTRLFKESPRPRTDLRAGAMDEGDAGDVGGVAGHSGGGLSTGSHDLLIQSVIARVDRLDLDDKEEEERMRDSAEDWSSGDESLDGRS